MTDDQQLNWEQIVEKHGKRVFRIAMRILGSVHDAEDVAQEVFIEAYQLHQAGPVQSWAGLLVRLSTLRSIDRIRKKRPTETLQDHSSFSTDEPFEETIATELANWLRSAIALLPDQQATVFVMVHFEQLTRDEVAASLGISPETVSTAMYKARQRLISQLSMFQPGNLT